MLCLLCSAGFIWEISDVCLQLWLKNTNVFTGINAVPESTSMFYGDGDVQFVLSIRDVQFVLRRQMEYQKCADGFTMSDGNIRDVQFVVRRRSIKGISKVSMTCSKWLKVEQFWVISSYMQLYKARCYVRFVAVTFAIYPHATSDILKLFYGNMCNIWHGQLGWRMSRANDLDLTSTWFLEHIFPTIL